MMYVREKPWHGLGTEVKEAPRAEEALKLAGLDWDVYSKPIFDENGAPIQGYHANARTTDDKILGVVSDRYTIIQNREAFDFTDSLIGEGLYYETAGSLRGGKQIWLLGKMPTRMIVGDEVEPYICFTNSHDGLGAVRCCMTPVRVVCNNTLNLAMKTARRYWATNHIGSITGKLQQARETLMLADIYLRNLEELGDKLANEKFTEGDMRDTLSELFPIDENMSERQKANIEKTKDAIMVCTLSPDLIKFANTKWNFVNAIADYAGHFEPLRKAKNWKENRWRYVMGGHALLDKAVSLIT